MNQCTIYFTFYWLVIFNPVCWETFCFYSLAYNYFKKVYSDFPYTLRSLVLRAVFALIVAYDRVFQDVLNISASLKKFFLLYAFEPSIPSSFSLFCNDPTVSLLLAYLSTNIIMIIANIVRAQSPLKIDDYPAIHSKIPGSTV